jgi:hypothetical protein
MTYNAEQITYMLAEAIDQDREYKSWHVSTKHLMTLVEMVVAQEREACAKLCYEETNKHPIGLVTWWATTHCAQAIEARGKA